MTIDKKRFGKIRNYRMGGDTRVQYAGILPADFASDAELNGAGTGLTIISGVITERCRQDGYIRQVICQIFRISGSDPRKGIKFKVFRPSGGNYAFVAESEYIIPADSEAQTYNLTAPMACQPGDILGVWIEADPADRVSVGALTRAGANSIRYAVGDIITTNAFASVISDLSLCVQGLGTYPYLAVTGDSIAEGQTAWLSHYDAGPAGTLSSEPWHQLRHMLPSSFEYQNHARGAQTFAWVLATGIVSALATGAHTVLIECGVNDIDTARTWANVESDLDDLYALFTASTTAKRLLICEILPWTAGTDAQALTIRTWNTNLATWCNTNNVTLVLCHDYLGQIRPATGQLDDLLASADLDGVHLTAAGYNQLAAVVKSYL